MSGLLKTFRLIQCLSKEDALDGPIKHATGHPDSDVTNVKSQHDLKVKDAVENGAEEDAHLQATPDSDVHQCIVKSWGSSINKRRPGKQDSGGGERLHALLVRGYGF